MLLRGARGVLFKGGYLWVLSLESANFGAHSLVTFLKYPCLGPQKTPSGRTPNSHPKIPPNIFHHNTDIDIVDHIRWYKH
jgi:hypothetical protein